MFRTERLLMYNTVQKKSFQEMKIFQLGHDPPDQILFQSSHVFPSINCNTLKFVPLKAVTLQNFLYFKRSSPVVVLWMLQTDANCSMISKSKLTPRINIRSCEVLVRSVDSCIAKEYTRNFQLSVVAVLQCFLQVPPFFAQLNWLKDLYLQTNWNS